MIAHGSGLLPRRGLGGHARGCGRALDGRRTGTFSITRMMGPRSMCSKTSPGVEDQAVRGLIMRPARATSLRPPRRAPRVSRRFAVCVENRQYPVSLQHASVTTPPVRPHLLMVLDDAPTPSGSPGFRPGSVARACGPARMFLVPDSCGSACIVAPRAAARVGSRVLAFGIAGVVANEVLVWRNRYTQRSLTCLG